MSRFVTTIHSNKFPMDKNNKMVCFVSTNFKEVHLTAFFGDMFEACLVGITFKEKQGSCRLLGVATKS